MYWALAGPVDVPVGDGLPDGDCPIDAEDELPDGDGSSLVDGIGLSVGELVLSLGGDEVPAESGEALACVRTSTMCGAGCRAVDCLLVELICALATKSLSRSGDLTSADVNVTLSTRSGPGQRALIAVMAPASVPAVTTTAIRRRHQLVSGFCAVS